MGAHRVDPSRRGELVSGLGAQLEQWHGLPLSATSGHRQQPQDDQIGSVQLFIPVGTYIRHLDFIADLVNDDRAGKQLTSPDK